MAFVADTEMVASFWLRPGSTHTANNVAGFLDNTLERLGDINCSLIRADSGFASDDFFVKTEDDEQFGKYRYGAMVTDLKLSALEIWRLYRGRANCESRIKELKYDFGADSFNQKKLLRHRGYSIKSHDGIQLHESIPQNLNQRHDQPNSEDLTLQTLRHSRVP